MAGTASTVRIESGNNKSSVASKSSTTSREVTARLGGVERVFKVILMPFTLILKFFVWLVCCFTGSKDVQPLQNRIQSNPQDYLLNPDQTIKEGDTSEKTEDKATWIVRNTQIDVGTAIRDSQSNIDDLIIELRKNPNTCFNIQKLQSLPPALRITLTKQFNAQKEESNGVAPTNKQMLKFFISISDKAQADIQTRENSRKQKDIGILNSKINQLQKHLINSDDVKNAENLSYQTVELISQYDQLVFKAEGRDVSSQEMIEFLEAIINGQHFVDMIMTRVLAKVVVKTIDTVTNSDRTERRKNALLQDCYSKLPKIVKNEFAAHAGNLIKQHPIFKNGEFNIAPEKWRSFFEEISKGERFSKIEDFCSKTTSKNIKEKLNAFITDLNNDKNPFEDQTNFDSLPKDYRDIMQDYCQLVVRIKDKKDINLYLVKIMKALLISTKKAEGLINQTRVEYIILKLEEGGDREVRENRLQNNLKGLPESVQKNYQIHMNKIKSVKNELVIFNHQLNFFNNLKF